MCNPSYTRPVWFESAGRKGLRYKTEDLDEGSACFIVIKCVHVCMCMCTGVQKVHITNNVRPFLGDQDF